MDLVHETIILRVNGSGAAQEASQDCRPGGTVNSAETGHDTSAPKRQLFSLKKQPALFMRRLGRALLRNPFASLLRIDAGAAGKKKRRADEPIDQVLHSIHVDVSIALGIPASRARAMQHQVKVLRAGVNLVPIS